MTVMPSPMLTDRFSRAFEFASVVHATQVRKGTRIPYLSHLLAVASLVIEHGADEDTAIAALLHDAAEDRGGKPMLEQIRARFGERVADTVHGCTDSFEKQKGPYAERKTRYVEHLAGDASEETCLVSAADKLHNARSILHDLRAAKNDAPAFWTRFGSTPAQSGWYYGRVETALERRLARPRRPRDGDGNPPRAGRDRGDGRLRVLCVGADPGPRRQGVPCRSVRIRRGPGMRPKSVQFGDGIASGSPPEPPVP